MRFVRETKEQERFFSRLLSVPLSYQRRQERVTMITSVREIPPSQSRTWRNEILVLLERLVDASSSSPSSSSCSALSPSFSVAAASPSSFLISICLSIYLYSLQFSLTDTIFPFRQSIPNKSYIHTYTHTDTHRSIIFLIESSSISSFHRTIEAITMRTTTAKTQRESQRKKGERNLSITGEISNDQLYKVRVYI